MASAIGWAAAPAYTSGGDVCCQRSPEPRSNWLTTVATPWVGVGYWPSVSRLRSKNIIKAFGIDEAIKPLVQLVGISSANAVFNIG